MSDKALDEARRHLAGFPVTASSRTKDWPGLQAEAIGVNVARNTTAPPRDQHVVSVCATASRRVLQRRGGAEHISPADIGDAFVMPAGLESTWDGTLPACIRLAVPTAEIENAAADLGVWRAPRIRNEFRVIDPALQRLAWWMNRALTAPDESRSRLEATGAATLLASHLLVRYSTAEVNHRRPDSGTRSRAVQRAITYIRDQLDADLTLQQIADEAHISKFHLSRTFHTEVGLPLTAYVRQTRITRAKILLNDDSLSIADIAGQVGYQQASQFIRAFRYHTGTTPGAWRRDM